MSSRKLLLLIASTLAVSVCGAFLMRGENQGLWLPLGVSIGSLVVSLLGAFKSDFFSFSPTLRDGEAMLVFVGRESDPRTALSTFVLRLHILNAGYADGIVRHLSVKVMRLSDGRSGAFHPVTELDMSTLLQTKGRGLHADNTLGAFMSFVVPAKAAISKAFLFVGDNPQLELSEGKYRFDVSGESSRGSITRHRFERPISGNDIEEYKNGSKVFLDGRSADLQT